MKKITIIGKKHALKKYDQFALNTSYVGAFGDVPDQLLPQFCKFTKFLLQKYREIAQLG